MIALDTNIVLRLIVQDDARQTAIAEKIAGDAKGAFYVSIIVLCETLWTLKKAYGFNKQQIITVTQRLAQSDDFIIEDGNVVIAALELADECTANMPDILIGLRNKRARCETTFTFDRQAAKLDAFTLMA